MQSVLTYILVTTVQDRLVAPAVLADARQSLDDTETELLALLAFVHGDILDVAHAPESAEELPLDEDGSDSNDAVRGLVDNDYAIVRMLCGFLCVELRNPGFLAWVGNHGQDREHRKVSALVVARR